MAKKTFIIALITLLTYSVSGLANSLLINFNNGSKYCIDLSEDLEYQFSDGSMMIQTPNSSLTLFIEDIDKISYTVFPASEIVTPEIEQQNPIFKYSGSSLTISARGGNNILEIHDLNGRKLFSTTFSDTYTFNPGEYIAGIAIITVNGKHSMKIKK